MRAAIINTDNIVTNVIELEPDADYVVTGYSIVFSEEACLGDLYENDEFTRPGAGV
jgi:hypothetical protein